MPIEFVRRLTETLSTPGTARTAFSTRALHAAQLIPVTENVRKGAFGKDSAFSGEKGAGLGEEAAADEQLPSVREQAVFGEQAEQFSQPAEPPQQPPFPLKCFIEDFTAGISSAIRITATNIFPIVFSCAQYTEFI